MKRELCMESALDDRVFERANEEMKRAMADLFDRPHAPGKREIVIRVELVPKIEEDSTGQKFVRNVAVDAYVEAKLPATKRMAASVVTLVDRKRKKLVTDDDNPDGNPDQINMALSAEEK